MNDSSKNHESASQPRSKAAHGQERSSGTSSLGLVTQLTREMTDLMAKEVALAKSEFTQAAHKAKTGVASVASGGMVLFAGFLILLLAAVIGLSEIMAPWLAAIIVGGVVCLIGFSMVKAGQQKLEPAAFKPDRTRKSLHKDKGEMRKHTTKGATT